jgi:ankyrin repeat protein
VHAPTHTPAAAGQTSKLANHKLLLAASCGDLGKFRRLVDECADLDASNEHGYTPLHLAAREGNLEVASFLATRPPPWVFKDAPANDGSTPLYHAIVGGYDKIAAILANALPKAMARQWHMTLAVQTGHLATVRALAGTHTGRDRVGDLAAAACSDTTHHILRFLVLEDKRESRSPQINVEPGPMQMSPLGCAIEGRAVLNVKLLLEAGAPTAGVLGGRLLLDAYHVLPEVVGTLLAFGACADLKNIEYDARYETDARKRSMLVDMLAATPKVKWRVVSDAGLCASAEARRNQRLKQNLRRVLAGVFAEVCAIFSPATCRTHARFTRSRGWVEVADQAFLVGMCKLPVELRFVVTKYVARNVVIAWARNTDGWEDTWWAAAGRGRAILPMLWRIPGGMDMLYGVDFKVPTPAMLNAYATPASLRPKQ